MTVSFMLYCPTSASRLGFDRVPEAGSWRNDQQAIPILTAEQDIYS
jgi:hypothetical protein